jgi:hypothetical protein
MNEAVAAIVGRALDAPAFPRLFEGRAGADLVDRFTHWISRRAATSPEQQASVTGDIAIDKMYKVSQFEIRLLHCSLEGITITCLRL